ncbi:MAG TPA: hypothetical protein VLW75_02100, partial [Rhizomicrobium sp.]|nr:hypothetical protein [Rhizomicrobium sp.]
MSKKTWIILGALFAALLGSAPATAGVAIDNAATLDPYDPVPPIQFRHWYAGCVDQCGCEESCYHRAGCDEGCYRRVECRDGCYRERCDGDCGRCQDGCERARCDGCDRERCDGDCGRCDGGCYREHCDGCDRDCDRDGCSQHIALPCTTGN